MLPDVDWPDLQSGSITIFLTGALNKWMKKHKHWLCYDLGGHFGGTVQFRLSERFHLSDDESFLWCGERSLSRWSIGDEGSLNGLMCVKWYELYAMAFAVTKSQPKWTPPSWKHRRRKYLFRRTVAVTPAAFRDLLNQFQGALKLLLSCSFPNLSLVCKWITQTIFSALDYLF